VCAKRFSPNLIIQTHHVVVMTSFISSGLRRRAKSICEK